VVTWQGGHLIGDCLRALRAQRVPAHVIVVDNGSTDGTAELVARDFPGVEVLRMAENLGYGRANNEAMRRALEAGARFVALVNNDVELDPDWLGQMIKAAREHPEAGLFCGTLLFRGEERVNSTGVEIDSFGRARDRDIGLPLEKLARADGPVEGVTGGAALLRTEMLRKIGLFDPAYFAYYEDVDLSLRARRAGFQCWYASAAVARHRFAATFGADSPRQRYLLGVGHLRTVALHQPLLKAAALVPLTVAYRAAVKAPLELLRARPRLALAELRAAAGGAWSALRAFSDRSRRPR
jgi:GT2 family glycosyltransferase